MKSAGSHRYRHWLRRALLRSALVIALIAVAVFFAIRLVPGDPAVMALGERASDAALAELREKLGLNLPLPGQFIRFLKYLSRGDTGISIKYGVSCRDLVLKAAPVTLALTALGVVVTAAASLALSCLAAARRDGLFDHLIRVAPAFTQGMPAFWLGLMLILAFSVNLRVFPVGGMKPGFWGGLHSLILPAVTVSFGQVPPLVRSLRERLIEAQSSDYVTALKACGLPRRRIFFGHALRNALIPSLMLFSVNVSYLIGGSLIVEEVFALRGMGRLLFEAIGNRDFPLVQAVALYSAVFVALVSLLTEAAVMKLDPRRGM